MKKFILFSMMLLAFAVTSCEKEETPEPQQQTLEQLYPDWKNLTWLETYRNSDNVKVQYPQMSITIDSNLVTIVTIRPPTDKYNVITNTYSKIAITGNYIEFRNNQPPTNVYKFEKSNDTMILNNGSQYEWRYKLKIN